MLKKIKKLTNIALAHEGFRRYFANMSWVFAEQFLRIIAGLTVGIWVARYMGPKNFGLFTYLIAYASIFSGFAKLGLDSILVRELVNDLRNRDIYLGTAFWLKLVGAFVVIAVTIVSTIFTNNDSKTNLYIFIISSGLIFQSFEVVDFYFQSKILSKFVSICKLTQLIISSILKICFVYINADLFWFVIIIFIDQLTLAITLFYSYKAQRLGYFYKYFDWLVAKNFLNTGWPLILSSLVLMLQARADQVMLKNMIGDIELGYYSSALRLIEAFGFVPVVITTSLFPAIINARKVSVKLYEYRIQSLYKLMLLLFLVIAIPVFFWGKETMIALYGYKYAPGADLLSLMVIRLIFTNYGVVRSAYLTSDNLMVYSFVSMCFGAFINILMNYLLIPTFHSKGAIYSSFISFFVSTFLIDLAYSKTRRNGLMMIESIFFIRMIGKKC